MNLNKGIIINKCLTCKKREKTVTLKRTIKEHIPIHKPGVINLNISRGLGIPNQFKGEIFLPVTSVVNQLWSGGELLLAFEREGYFMCFVVLWFFTYYLFQ